MNETDNRRDAGEFYPGGRNRTRIIVEHHGDVSKSDFEGVNVKTNTIPDLRAAVRELGRRLGATVVTALAVCVSTGATVETAKLNDLDFDTDPQVVTNVTLSGLATTGELNAATNSLGQAITAAVTNIQKSALAQNVQASLDKADAALPTTGGTMTGDICFSNSFSDVAAELGWQGAGFGVRTANGGQVIFPNHTGIDNIALQCDVDDAIQQIAPAFTSKAYAMNELCTYGRVVYRCKLGYIAAESSAKPNSDTQHWEPRKVSELFLPTAGGRMTGDIGWENGIQITRDAPGLVITDTYGKYWYFYESGQSTVACRSDIATAAQSATNYTDSTARSIEQTVPNNITRTANDTTLVYYDGTNIQNLIYLRQATHSLAGLMTAADKTALDALVATAVTRQTVTNVVDEVKELHYDDELGVTWETRIVGGEMKFFAVTNTNISVLGN